MLLALLATAFSLEPDVRGYGTHQRLGLPPCRFLALTGVRCPSCGMTTSWAHLVRGQFVPAWKANAGGALLGAAALAAGPWLLASGIRGRWFWGAPSDWSVIGAGFVVLGTTLADWCLRFFTGR